MNRKVILNSPACFTGYLPCKQGICYKVGLLGFDFKAKHLLLPPYLLKLLSETINRSDNFDHHLLFCSQNQQSLYILHHAPFLQLSLGVEFS